VITSTDDTLIPSAVSAPMADAIPGATLLVIEGAGHLSNLEQSDTFSGALEEHVERAGLRG
jgi:pimeloyl-ACP methyl ester carboxylesterase